MSRRRSHRYRQLTERLIRDSVGAAAVEFALIATFLFVLLGGVLDLSQLVTARRDAERVAVEVAQTLAACNNTSCILQAGQVIMDGNANAFLTTSKPTVSWAYVSRNGSKILVSFGNMTYLEADLEAAAKIALPANNDNGVCTMVKSKVTSFGILTTWFNAAKGEQRYFVCALQSKAIKVI